MTIFLYNIFLHYSTFFDKEAEDFSTAFFSSDFRPRSTKYYGIRQKIFVESGIILSKFSKKDWRIIILQSF